MYCGQTRALLEPRQGADGKLPPCPEGPDELSGMSFHVVDLFDVAFFVSYSRFLPCCTQHVDHTEQPPQTISPVQLTLSRAFGMPLNSHS